MRTCLGAVHLLLLLLAGCGGGGSSDAAVGGDRPPPPGSFPCSGTFCRLNTEACVYPRLADPRCEPRLDPMGANECRVHVDAYCGGSGDRCTAGPEGGLPDGAYVVLCL